MADKPAELTAWIELVDATEITDTKNVDDIIKKILKDPHCDSDGLLWNKSFTTPMQLEIQWWDEVLPDFANKLDEIGERLMPGEYMIFEEKVKTNHRADSAIRYILVTQDHVEYLDTSSIVAQLRLKVQELKAEHDEEVRNRDHIDI